MPEQISKYPEVTLGVLKGAGARCGEGVKQKILDQCPPKQFCALPTGEICVYGIEQIPQMTQITAEELARIVCPAAKPSSMDSAAIAGPGATVLAAALAVGLLAGRFWRSLKAR